MSLIIGMATRVIVDCFMAIYMVIPGIEKISRSNSKRTKIGSIYSSKG
jgi:hypothetical protein